MSLLSDKLGIYCQNNKLVIITAESCTAGLLAASIAQTSGSSAWLEGGYIVYTKEAKNKFLNVSLETIKNFNITSEEVAKEMACGALKNGIVSNVSLAVTGVAGPGGGSLEIPVGTVCMAWAFKDMQNKSKFVSETFLFKGNRNIIRKNVVQYMLNKIFKVFLFVLSFIIKKTKDKYA